MILFAFFALIALASAVAFANWRTGLYWFVVIGLLQDPVRKLIPGTPGYLVLATSPVWIALALRTFVSPDRRAQIGRAYPRLAKVVRLFLLSLLPAALISATYGARSWMLTVLGAFTYASLVYSAVLGYRFARDTDALRRFFSFYCVLTAALLGGTILEYLHIPFPAVGVEMLGFQWVRHIPGTIVYMVSGFFRSPDVMGWHAAMVAMLALTLALSTRAAKRWPWVAVAVWAAGLAILCGRRKMVFMIPFFVVALVVLYWKFGRRLRIVPVIAVIAVALAGVLVLYTQVGTDESFMTYYTNDPKDVYVQAERHGFDSVIGTVRQYGIFGAGLGSASTGAHHLNVERPRVWQESGPSKIMVEVGVPGFVCFIFLALVLFKSILGLFVRKLLVDGKNFALWAGLFAIVLANGGSFVVSAQIFGDPFISCLLAFLIGTLLSAVRLEPRLVRTIEPRSLPLGPAPAVAPGVVASVPR